MRRARQLGALPEQPATSGVDAALLTTVAERIPAGPAAVAVLSASATGSANALRAEHPEAVVEVCDASLSDSERHVRLTAAGPFDVIVDDHGGKSGRKIRFQNTFFHLRGGGVLVVRGAATEVSAKPGKLGALLARAEAARDTPTPAPAKGVPMTRIDTHALADALAEVSSVGGHLVVRTRATGALAKLNEPEANSYLSLPGDRGGRVLELIASEHFASRCVLRENAPTRGRNQPASYDPIAIALREYRQVVVTPGQVVSNERVVFPDSYRHNQAKRLRNRYTDELGPRFARLQHGTDDLEMLSGTYFHLDNEVRGHFGHLMTEQLSRMWAWPAAKERVPDLKVLVAINKDREMRGWEYDVYAAAGIARDDIVFLREPVRVERLLTGSPMLSNPKYVHPRIAETWRRVGDNLAAGATDREYPRRIFCSRRIAKRACNNTDEVEALFVAQGFEIVFPEEFALGDQVEMFRRADVVAGFAGSGLFNLCFTTEPKRVVMISSDVYSARNEYLIASVLGHEIDSITSRPDIPGEFQSPFTFDQEREGRYLEGVFASLP